MNTKQNFYLNGMFRTYINLNIHQKINERQKRNGLNINYLFSTVIHQQNYTKYEALHPVINNGLYHHIGKNHSQYPKNK
jgi:hypothetical protein